MDTGSTIVCLDTQVIVLAQLVLIGLMLYQYMDKLFHRLSIQYLPLRLPLMSEHCTKVLDDVIRDEEQEIARRWVAENPGFTLELLLDGHGMAVLSR